MNKSRGNSHPTKKTCYSRPVVVYKIATGDRREYKSVTQAAAAVQMCQSWFGQVLRSSMHANGFICAYVEDEDKAIEKLRNYQSRGEYEKPTTIFCSEKPKKKMVMLMVKKGLWIQVPEENATPEYAERYLHRLEERNKTNSEKQTTI